MSYGRPLFSTKGNEHAFPRRFEDRVVAEEHPESPYPVKVPDTLKRVGFIEKDSKRFPETNGWGYARFTYDLAAAMFMPEETDPAFDKALCHAHLTLVRAEDYMFTVYPAR